MSSFNVCNTPINHGLTLLEAGAGTGKTYSLVRVIARHLVENDLSIDQILTVTFTRAATAEIKGRLHELLSEISTSLKNPDLPADKTNDLVAHWRANESDEFLDNARIRISIALANFDSVAIFTIDGFFQRLIKEFAFEANQLFSVELDTDETKLIHTALRDYWRQHVYCMNQADLDTFQSYIKFDKAQSFITEALRNPHAKFDDAYQQSPSDHMAPYQALWKKFITKLNTQRATIIDFITNPPAGFKKAGYPFFKSGVPMSHIIDSMLANTSAPLINLGYLPKISFSNLQSDSSFNKGKSVDLSGHPLAELFKTIDELTETSPQHLQSAYLGDILRFVRTRLDQLKKERNVKSYSDVTNALADLLREDSATSESMKQSIKNKFHAGLIDEFQDTSPQQCTVFLNLFHHPDRYFHIIGDPKQSIYRFRGADVFSYIEAKNKADDEFSLLTNYRSTPRMIHAVNQLYQMSDDPFLVDEKITFAPALWQGQDQQEDQAVPPQGVPALHIHAISPALKNAEPIRQACYRSVARETAKLLGTPWSTIDPEKDGVIKPSDIAILVRSGKDGFAINDELTRLNIPVTVNTRTSLIESEETADVFTILTALLEPRKSDLLRMALLSASLGGGQLLAPNNDAEFDSITHQMADLHKRWHQLGLMPMMLDFVQQFNVRTRLLGLQQGQRRITNFMHVIELLDDKARTQKLTPTATVQWLEMAIQGSILDTESEVLELRIATDDAAVQIRTQHTSKGLEFPITFITSPCPSDLQYLPPQSSYHDPDSLDPMFAAIENKDGDIYEFRKKETFADASRLAYVALTRSKYICHFYLTPQSKGNPEDHAMFQMLGMPNEAALLALAENSHGCVVYDTIEPDIFELPNPPWSGKGSETNSAPALKHRDPALINITHSQRTTSFTGITRNAPEIIHDSDPDTPSETTTEPVRPTSTTAPTGATSPNFWEHLQAGASLGLVFHETLEEIDFQNTSGAENLIEEKLLKYSPWKEKPKPQQLHNIIGEIQSSLDQLVSHPLSASETDTITLDQISKRQRLTEPGFLLSGTRFSLQSLCQILTKDPPVTLPSDYLQQLQSAPPRSLDGFLTGFIDLIFEHNGRYHLLDWKTNRLRDYSPTSIAESMADHHYYLQYHLYTLALDRLLAHRLGDAYNPAQHLGSTYYVYLRGIDPTLPGRGIFTDQITPTRLNALRQAFQ